MKEEERIGQAPQDELAYRVAYLIAGYIGETLSQQEHQELDDWVCASMDNQRLFEELTDPKNLDAWLKWKEKLPTAQVLERLKSKLVFTPEPKKIRSRSWPRYAAAATILVAIVASVVLFQFNDHSDTKKGVSILVKDISPGANRAILTLSDGRTISLDSAKNGNLTSQGNVNVNKQDSGLLSYQIINPSILPALEEYNTLTVPPGGQYRVQLPDGTNVWLNASSSLKYPTVFHGSKRKVELSGEGYFEVAKDPMHPFEVTAGNASVEVLGTHFDINAYTNEPDLKVTLAEGSVRVNHTVVLKPGQQALVNQKTEIKTVAADLEAELAWKNGVFLFKETPLDAVMRQVSRWYNAEISFDENITDHFNADIPRSVPVSKLLHLLEATGRVHFKIEDKKIIVMK